MEIVTSESADASRQRSPASVAGRSLAPTRQGELDWIAMKALEKDRNRRFDSRRPSGRRVAVFAERHLAYLRR